MLFAFLLMFSGPARAEMPPVVVMSDAVPKSDAVFVGRAVRVEFQALADGQSWRGDRMHAFWTEYRVTESLKGAYKAGDLVRVQGTTIGCEPGPRTITRKGDVFLDQHFHDAAVPLDPKLYLPTEPLLLVIDVDGSVIRHQDNGFAEPARPKALAEVRSFIKP